MCCVICVCCGVVDCFVFMYVRERLGSLRGGEIEYNGLRLREREREEESSSSGGGGESDFGE